MNITNTTGISKIPPLNAERAF